MKQKSGISERFSRGEKMKEDCFTGACPVIDDHDKKVVKLSEGAGGKEMEELISVLTKKFFVNNDWSNIGDDAASIEIGKKRLFFTSDSYVVTPIFFPGGNIGKIAFCGTVNDLAVMGARPLGISLSLVIEEGFDKEELNRIIDSIAELSKETNIPIVTGDTKVMEKGSIDKIIINTSGVGIAEHPLDKELKTGDKVIISGGIGEHGTALIAKRFDIETSVITDSKPLYEEIESVNRLIKQAKDITRGGIAAILNEIAEKNNVGILVNESEVPVLKEVRALTNILGIDAFNLACEGRFVCIASEENSVRAVELLKRFNDNATIIGEVTNDGGVIVQTRFGKKLLSKPSGNLVPRIC